MVLVWVDEASWDLGGVGWVAVGGGDGLPEGLDGSGIREASELFI